MGTIADNVTASGCSSSGDQLQDPSEILSTYRPPSVTESCTNDIPETIIEEAETGLEGGVRRNSNVSRKIETIADIVQSSSESNTSVSDGEVRKIVSLSTEIQRWHNNENISITGSISGSRESQEGTRNKVNNEPEINLLGDENDPAFQNSLNTNSVNSTNSKVKPIQGQSFEKAVGFLLESKARRNPMVVKRVKFN